MIDRDQWEHLRRQTGRAVAESASKEAVPDHARRRPPGSGDVYVLSEDPESPMEWVVLMADTANPRRLIAVPADTNPMAGSRDLALDDPSAGPLVLRLGFAKFLDVGTFEPAMRRGVLKPESLERARHVYRVVESGDARGSVRQREIDADPAYQDWIRDLVEPAAEALQAEAAETSTGEKVLAFPDRSVSAPREPPRRMVAVGWVYGLAAALAVVSVGLSGWIVKQQRLVSRLSRPSFDLPISQIRLNNVERSTEPISVPPDAQHLLLFLVLDEEQPCDSYNLELLASGRRVVWTQPMATWPIDDVSLVLPRSVLEQGPLTLRLHGICGDERRLLDERQLRIKM